MKLTSIDYQNIASQIEEGKGTVEYTKGNETLILDYSYEVNGYVEDDYYNGTGAFVQTDCNLYIESAESFNEDGDETENDFNESILYKQVA